MDWGHKNLYILWLTVCYSDQTRFQCYNTFLNQNVFVHNEVHHIHKLLIWYLLLESEESTETSAELLQMKIRIIALLNFLICLIWRKRITLIHSYVRNLLSPCYLCFPLGFLDRNCLHLVLGWLHVLQPVRSCVDCRIMQNDERN